MYSTLESDHRISESDIVAKSPSPKKRRATAFERVLLDILESNRSQRVQTAWLELSHQRSSR